MAIETNHYGVLRLKPGSSYQDVRRQYRRMAKIYHPDRNPGEEEWCAEQLAQVNAAYEFLSDPTRKAAYDRNLALSDPLSARASGDRNRVSRQTGPSENSYRSDPSSAPQTYVASAISPRRVIVLMLGTIACVFLGATLAALVYGVMHPGGLTRLNLPTISLTMPNNPATQASTYTPAPAIPKRAHHHRRTSRREGTQSVSEERIRLARLGVVAPSSGFSAEELRRMADRVQQYDESH